MAVTFVPQRSFSFFLFKLLLSLSLSLSLSCTQQLLQLVWVNFIFVSLLLACFFLFSYTHLAHQRGRIPWVWPCVFIVCLPLSLSLSLFCCFRCDQVEDQQVVGRALAFLYHLNYQLQLQSPVVAF